MQNAQLRHTAELAIISAREAPFVGGLLECRVMERASHERENCDFQVQKIERNQNEVASHSSLSLLQSCNQLNVLHNSVRSFRQKRRARAG